MNAIIYPRLNDLADIVNIDREIIGNDSRRELAIEEHRCIAVKQESLIVGFLKIPTKLLNRL